MDFITIFQGKRVVTVCYCGVEHEAERPSAGTLAKIECDACGYTALYQWTDTYQRFFANAHNEEIRALSSSEKATSNLG
jgi:hypothetical protein